MNTLYNAVTATKEAIVGKDETTEQAEKSGQEPVAGKTGRKDEGTAPYDAGNLPTPLASPMSDPSGAPPLPTASTAAHTSTTPTAPKVDNEAASSAAAVPVPVTDGEPTTTTNTETTTGTNADTSGPNVGNAKLVPGGEPTGAKSEPLEYTPVVGDAITSPAEAEKAIKKDAKEADPEVGKAEKKQAVEEKKEIVGEKKEAMEDKVGEMKEKAKEAAPITPKKSTSESVDESPAASTKSGKKRLSTRLKEKLHIGSSSKKDKS
ncbi:MAG: hypothetical protein MMC23_005199 [Stictis urceolatum]|nr:hypothetical protein [Stictis urceolata]